MILISFVSTVTIIGFVYGLLQRFKIEDINHHVCRLETKINKLEDEILKERINSKKLIHYTLNHFSLI